MQDPASGLRRIPLKRTSEKSQNANFAITEFSEVRYRKQRTCNSKNTMFGRYAAPSKPC